jgi:AraC-like DNA-binding protein
MKPIYLKVANSPQTSIDIRHETAPYFRNPWHFHPELELTLILASTGTRFIGNSIGNFYEDELTLTGPNLPHYWRNDPDYYEKESVLKAEAIIVRFPEHFLGKEFFQLPEMHHVNNLFKISLRGLKIFGQAKKEASEKMRAMIHMNGAERIIALLQILNAIAISAKYKVLSSIGFIQTYGKPDVERINNVYTYVLENFLHPINLSEVASIANMNPTAFSRYFKAKTGKTFTQFLYEIRIEHAYKLLIDGKFNVSQVCYECGFQNQSHFIKQFRRITHQTPLQYQNEHNKTTISF